MSFHRRFSDGSVDHTSPHRKGSRFLDLNDQAKLAADEAYEQRRTRLSNAWRDKGEQQDAADPVRTPSNTPARTVTAEQAYEERTKKRQTAWRH
jgi:hypothetical protein